MKTPYPFIIFIAALTVVLSCESSQEIMPDANSKSISEPSVTSQHQLSLPGNLVIQGNPSSAAGATWTYIENGQVRYDLQGVLFSPPGSGPFPAVIINHGTGGNANGYSRSIAREMVKWGYVCIATNYTHASSVPCGSPGICNQQSEWGASQSNILRGYKCLQILSSLPYVNTSRIVSFGHSRGAFVTTALAGAYPESFSAFAHTAGGVSDSPSATAPGTDLAEAITKPYLIHHGDNDRVVHIGIDRKLEQILVGNNVPARLDVYPGYSHQDVRNDPTMFARTRAWFEMYNP